jgi:hypothetical protein
VRVTISLTALFSRKLRETWHWDWRRYASLRWPDFTRVVFFSHGLFVNLESVDLISSALRRLGLPAALRLHPVIGQTVSHTSSSRSRFLHTGTADDRRNFRMGEIVDGGM